MIRRIHLAGTADVDLGDRIFWTALSVNRESSRTSEDQKNAPNPLIDLLHLLGLVGSLRLHRAAGST